MIELVKDSNRADIQMYGAILNRIHLMLIDIFSKDALSMNKQDLSSTLAGLDFGCVERIAKSKSKLSILINDKRNHIMFTFFAKIQSDKNYNPPQMKSFIANSVAPYFKNLYNDSKEIINIENNGIIPQLRKNSEFEQFYRKAA